MYSMYQVELMARRVHEERLRYSELRRTRDLALRRSRMRNTLRRAIEDGLRYGIEPHEVEREFATTLEQMTSR